MNDEPRSSHGAMATPTQPPEEKAAVASWRLIATLAVAGALAGLMIVLVYGWAQPRIEAHQAKVLRLAVQEVLHEPARYERLFVHGAGLAADLPAGVDSTTLERVYRGFDESGQPIGYALLASKAGFQDQIRVLFGFDPRTGRLLGMKVLESKETPGLGDKIEKDSAFVGAFRGVATPLRGVKSGAGTGADGDVDMITGATISSRTIIDAINLALERLRPRLQAYAAGGTP